VPRRPHIKTRPQFLNFFFFLSLILFFLELFCTICITSLHWYCLNSLNSIECSFMSPLLPICYCKSSPFLYPLKILKPCIFTLPISHQIAHQINFKEPVLAAVQNFPASGILIYFFVIHLDSIFLTLSQSKHQT
jgi:hypothetical protein